MNEKKKRKPRKKCLQIVIDDHLHYRLKVKAAQMRSTITNVIIGYIRHSLNPSKPLPDQEVEPAAWEKEALDEQATQ